ncbi:zinc finger, CCHC-type containing protein [Tanacetum coccineum]
MIIRVAKDCLIASTSAVIACGIAYITAKTSALNSRSSPDLLLQTREGGVNKKSWKKGKGKSKDRKNVFPPLKKESVAKDAECFHCGKIGHWETKSPSYIAN